VENCRDGLPGDHHSSPGRPSRQFSTDRVR